MISFIVSSKIFSRFPGESNDESDEKLMFRRILRAGGGSLIVLKGRYAALHGEEYAIRAALATGRCRG